MLGYAPQRRPSYFENITNDYVPLQSDAYHTSKPLISLPYPLATDTPSKIILAQTGISLLLAAAAALDIDWANSRSIDIPETLAPEASVTPRRPRSHGHPSPGRDLSHHRSRSAATPSPGPSISSDEDLTSCPASPKSPKKARKSRGKTKSREERVHLLKSDPWIAEGTVRAHEVECKACSKPIKMDSRNPFYPYLWQKHRKGCRQILKLTGGEKDNHWGDDE